MLRNIEYQNDIFNIENNPELDTKSFQNDFFRLELRLWFINTNIISEFDRVSNNN